MPHKLLKKTRALVTFAVDAEFAPWRKLRRFETRHIDVPGHSRSVELHSTSISGLGVDVFLTGIGLKGAEPSLTQLIGQSPDICISTGLAGALNEKLQVGNIVAAAESVDLNGGSIRYCQRHLIESAALGGATVVRRFVTSSRVLVTSEDKRNVSIHGDVVEMEGYGIISKAFEKGIPTILLRAISDTALENLPMDFNDTTDSDGRINITRILMNLTQKPGQIANLIKFGKQSRNAAEKLAVFLEMYLNKVAVIAQRLTEAKAGIAK